MNVIISNERQNELSNLNIEIIKSIISFLPLNVDGRSIEVFDKKIQSKNEKILNIEKKCAILRKKLKERRAYDQKK